MPQSNPIPECPAGLEYLYSIDKIHVEQLVELLEGQQHIACSLNFTKFNENFLFWYQKAFVGWETNNKYVVKNDAGQQLFYAFESKSKFLCCIKISRKEKKLWFLQVVAIQNL